MVLLFGLLRVCAGSSGFACGWGVLFGFVLRFWWL